MTTTADTALAFAKICMGWKYPVDRRYSEQNKDIFGQPSKVWTPYLFDYEGKNEPFRFTDLNAVMAVIRAWCDKTGLAFSILTLHPTLKVRWVVHVCSASNCWLATESGDDLCEALMACCVAASRKLGSRSRQDAGK